MDVLVTTAMLAASGSPVSVINPSPMRLTTGAHLTLPANVRSLAALVRHVLALYTSPQQTKEDQLAHRSRGGGPLAHGLSLAAISPDLAKGRERLAADSAWATADAAADELVAAADGPALLLFAPWSVPVALAAVVASVFQAAAAVLDAPALARSPTAVALLLDGAGPCNRASVIDALLAHVFHTFTPDQVAVFNPSTPLPARATLPRVAIVIAASHRGLPDLDNLVLVHTVVYAASARALAPRIAHLVVAHGVALGGTPGPGIDAPWALVAGPTPRSPVFARICIVVVVATAPARAAFAELTTAGAAVLDMIQDHLPRNAGGASFGPRAGDYLRHLVVSLRQVGEASVPLLPAAGVLVVLAQTLYAWSSAGWSYASEALETATSALVAVHPILSSTFAAWRAILDAGSEADVKIDELTKQLEAETRTSTAIVVLVADDHARVGLETELSHIAASHPHWRLRGMHPDTPAYAPGSSLVINAIAALLDARTPSTSLIVVAQPSHVSALVVRRLLAPAAFDLAVWYDAESEAAGATAAFLRTAIPRHIELHGEALARDSPSLQASLRFASDVESVLEGLVEDGHSLVDLDPRLGAVAVAAEPCAPPAPAPPQPEQDTAEPGPVDTPLRSGPPLPTMGIVASSEAVIALGLGGLDLWRTQFGLTVAAERDALPAGVAFVLDEGYAVAMVDGWQLSGDARERAAEGRRLQAMVSSAEQAYDELAVLVVFGRVGARAAEPFPFVPARVRALMASYGRTARARSVRVEFVWCTGHASMGSAVRSRCEARAAVSARWAGSAEVWASRSWLLAEETTSERVLCTLSPALTPFTAQIALTWSKSLADFALHDELEALVRDFPWIPRKVLAATTERAQASPCPVAGVSEPATGG
ncbi:uncharacterized protein AMSG_06445 [Thecamonas trahens ATCC 50062]|uniref:Uncharacterized protein n=1 Tax=Thecamonas trahens ATCC 50062 TaxID=461836 RepID=A0A0L0DDS4_THETB|nr:hypothetical protein AMSG_06445 [Thecamonas trahens ATCC 50062]KNC50286.1 hypothetical protein AMSG_06445 [Thecamonas trahens ATCC 50062]|eukprot:XP_013757113.1 hypothetical protein AMSG_06445 [Thecamonas trahens ATCC 50062]